MKKVKVAAAVALLLSLGSASSFAASLQIELALPKPDHGPYHRPYVAVWIEDQAEKPVRLLEIWREKPDWIKDLRRVWRKTGRADQPLVDARTGATKGPGVYHLKWQGDDNAGKLVGAGEYLLVIEAAREHGGRNIVKQKFNWDGSAIDLSLPAGSEIGAVSLKSGK